jgi:hypothetical protein
MRDAAVYKELVFYDDYGDMVASVPAEWVELLRSRGLLRPADKWPQL